MFLRVAVARLLDGMCGKYNTDLLWSANAASSYKPHACPRVSCVLHTVCNSRKKQAATENITKHDVVLNSDLCFSCLYHRFCEGGRLCPAMKTRTVEVVKQTEDPSAG